MRRLLTLVLWALALVAQEPDLSLLTLKLREAIANGDWKTAAELSEKIKDATHKQRDLAFSRSNQTQVDAILTWLPADTETVIVAEHPWIRKESKGDGSFDARVFTMMELEEAESLRDALNGRTLRFSLLAARNFANHPPREGTNFLPLGMIAYEGCGLYAFAEPVGDLQIRSSPQEQIGGLSAWTIVIESKEGAPPTTLRLAMLDRDTLIACNSRSFLEQVLAGRKSSRDVSPAFPPGLPMWKYVDRAAPLWAMRRFRPDRVGKDPTYPRNDEGAIGMTAVFYDSPPSANARWISRSATNYWKRLAESPDFYGHSKTARLADGTWELTAEGQQALQFAVFSFLAGLGLAIYL